MLGYSGILSALERAILADADLAAWCQDQFGKSLTLVQGLDPRQPPGEDQAPFVVLDAVEAEDGDSVPKKEYQVLVGWGVVNDSVETDGQVIRHPGQAQADQMAKLLWAAMREAHPRLTLAEAGYSLTMELFPQHLGTLIITVRVPAVIGAEITIS